jgi:hypothetical protein
MKRNIPKNYNKSVKYGLYTPASTGVLCYGADIRHCRLLLCNVVKYESLFFSIDYCLEFLSRMYSKAAPSKNSTRIAVPSKKPNSENSLILI